MSIEERQEGKRTTSKRTAMKRKGRPGSKNQPLTLDTPEGIALALIALLIASVAIPLMVTPVRETVFRWASSASDWMHNARPAAVEDIPVAAEGSGRGYNREAKFGRWQRRGGCWEDQIIAQRDVQNGQLRGCRMIGGTVTDLYDGSTTAYRPGAFQVDHVVSLAEAWRSGASGWTQEQRVAYANDPDVLVLVKAAENQAKSDKDPGQWQPATAAGRCAYAHKVVEIKYHYHLTMDAREAAAVQRDLAQC